jgi:hypothetical protein
MRDAQAVFADFSSPSAHFSEKMGPLFRLASMARRLCWARLAAQSIALAAGAAGALLALPTKMRHLIGVGWLKKGRVVL